MRLNFTLSSNSHPVPFDYQHSLTGAFHKWLPDNTFHDDISLYSLSWLSRGKRKESSLDFPQGSEWFVSFYDEKLAKQLLVNIFKDAGVAFGMRVIDIQIQKTPEFSDIERFAVASPILAKQPDGESIRHRIFSEPEADKVLTDTLQHKLRTAGLSDDIDVRFDREYPGAKTKLVTIKGIKNRASLCPVIIEGNPESLAFAWNVGVGHGTGSGFGAIL